MNQFALHSRLIEGTESAYEAEHATVWPELITAMQRAGIRDWRIWRSGRDLFHLVDCDDFEAALRQLADDPDDRRWQRHMSAYVEGFAETADSRVLRRVGALSEQLAAEAAESGSY